MAAPAPSAKSIATEARLNALIDRLGKGMRAVNSAARNNNTDQGDTGSGGPTAYDFNQLVGRVNHAKDIQNAIVDILNDVVAALTQIDIIT